ncbi:MAG: hypothetical protein ACI843_001236 [Psychrobacter glaciei]|jgi:hypothetical protein
MNIIQLDKLVQNIFLYSEAQASGFGQIIIAIQEFKKAIRANFAVKANFNYYFKARSKI